MRFRPARNQQSDERIMKSILVASTLAVVAIGCDNAVGSEPPYQVHSYIVGIDISGSRNRTDLDESKKLLDGVIDRLQVGDHLTLIEVYHCLLYTSNADAESRGVAIG